MNGEPTLLPASRLIALYRSGELSPLEVAQAGLSRITRFNSTLNAVCHVDEEATLAQARSSESRWRRGEPIDVLDGVPVTIKDVMNAEGWPTRRGSRTTSAEPAKTDAPMVRRLREAGAVFLCKTTTAEFGWKGVTDNPLTGITRNPWNPELTPGGSSGGAAAALAVGIGTLATASDAAGSIRMPASFCGLFGFKASVGVVPTYPRSSFGTLSHSGPITRTVADAATMLTVSARADPRAASLPSADVNYTAGLEVGVAGLRIGYSPDLGYARVTAEIRAHTDAAVRQLAELGAIVELVDSPFREPRQTIDVQWRASLIDILSHVDVDAQGLVDPELVAMAQDTAPPTLADFLQSEYERVELAAKMKQFHTRYDCLVTPVLPMPAFVAGKLVAEPPQRSWLDWSPFCYPFNLTGQPAASVPVGLTREGLPVGLQIVGGLWDDRRVLRASYALESVYPPILPPMSRH